MTDTLIVIEQVDVILCEDNQTVLFFGYDASDSTYLQSIELPMAIERTSFLGDDWLQALRREAWRQVA